MTIMKNRSADLTADVTETLEALIDQTSLLDVLVGLELVCGEKAEHIRQNWQDMPLARLWNRCSKVCGTAARHEAVQLLP